MAMYHTLPPTTTIYGEHRCETGALDEENTVNALILIKSYMPNHDLFLNLVVPLYVGTLLHTPHSYVFPKPK